MPPAVSSIHENVVTSSAYCLVHFCHSCCLGATESSSRTVGMEMTRVRVFLSFCCVDRERPHRNIVPLHAELTLWLWLVMPQLSTRQGERTCVGGLINAIVRELASHRTVAECYRKDQGS